MSKPRIVIICPTPAASNNGNWHTASRWAAMLSPLFESIIVQDWQGEPFDAMLALHARRSASSIARWAVAKGAAFDVPGLGVVLTGTDLYSDIQTDISAQASLDYAHRLIVLQECAPEALPRPMQDKARVIFQSTLAMAPALKTARHLRAVMVGHLREVKSPKTLFTAAQLLQDQSTIFIDHIGEALDARLGAQAVECAVHYPNYRYLGGLTHTATLRHIQRAHVLVHASELEGGAHVVMEAICSGTPVLASKIAGNVGMLGAEYAGYFEHGDAQALANLLVRCCSEFTGAPSETNLNDTPSLYAQLASQCEQRASLFLPDVEQAALIAVVQELLKSNSDKENH